jgi:purine-cytosine permease-like protein
LIYLALIIFILLLSTLVAYVGRDCKSKFQEVSIGIIFTLLLILYLALIVSAIKRGFGPF